MHDLDLILTLAGGFTAALIFGYVTHRAGESILERLGATAEQIDRERSRAHRELFGKEPAA